MKRWPDELEAGQNVKAVCGTTFQGAPARLFRNTRMCGRCELNAKAKLFGFEMRQFAAKDFGGDGYVLQSWQPQRAGDLVVITKPTPPWSPVKKLFDTDSLLGGMSG